MIVLNKTDLVDGAALEAVEAELRGHMRKGTAIVRAANGHVDALALLGLGIGSEDDLSGRESHHEMDHGGEGHEHDDFDSFSVTLPSGLGRDQLLSAIADTIATHDVLRLKGFAAIPGARARLAIQAVGPRVNAYFDRDWREGEEQVTRLVVIGESPLARDAIEVSLKKVAQAA
jgi:cobalamin biosynthesis protein CobW